MTITRNDLIAQLKYEDEVLLLELLGITSEDILNRFDDLIELNYDKLLEDYGDYEQET